MTTTSALFYIFSAVLLASSFGVITARSTVHAALFLVLAFFNASCLWMMLKAEFLAITLVLVYVGAVMVLFLFVVMMLDIDTDKLRENFWGYLPVASFVGVIIVLEMAAVLWRSFLSFDQQAVNAGNIGGTKELGLLIYTKYIYGFEIAAVVLLVAIIAAVALTLRKRKDTKHFDPADAVRVKRNDRLKIVKIDPVSNRGQAAVESNSEVKEAP
jgi:NADH-quinone oxidoreductase subunit J